MGLQEFIKIDCIEYSDILSTLAIIASIYTYFYSKRKLDKQQVIINDITIKKAKQEDIKEKSANLRAFRDKTSKCLVIQNVGMGTARNIRIVYNNLNSENGFWINDFNKFPYPLLNTSDEIKLPCQIMSRINTIPVINLLWDDDNGENHTKEQSVDIY